MPVEFQPKVTLAIAALAKSRELACGGETLSDSENVKHVSRNDMLVAFHLAAGAYDFFRDLDRLRQFRGGWGAFLGKIGVGIALSNLHSLKDRLERYSESNLGKEFVESDSFRSFSNNINPTVMIKDLFEVLNDERPWAESIGKEIDDRFEEWWYDNAEMTISMLPVVGTLFDLSMAAYGKTLMGRQRSLTERKLLVVGALLPGVLKVVSRGVKITTRTMFFASMQLGNGVVLKDLRSAARLAVAMRELTTEELKELKLLSQIGSKGISFTVKQEVRAAYFLNRIREAATAAEWLSIALTELNSKTLTPGTSYVLRHATPTSEELRAGQAIARALNEPVVFLPEKSAVHYLKGIVKSVQGHKHPDLLLGGRLADIYVPRVAATTKEEVRKLFRYASKKHTQAGVIVVDLSPLSHDTELIYSSIGREFWGTAEGWVINKVVFLEKNGIAKVMPKPDKYLIGFGGSLARMGRLIEDWTEVYRVEENDH